MDRDEGYILGPIDADGHMDYYYDPIPKSPDTGNGWLPKTDWSKDGIIANEDFD